MSQSAGRCSSGALTNYALPGCELTVEELMLLLGAGRREPVWQHTDPRYLSLGNHQAEARARKKETYDS